MPEFVPGYSEHSAAEGGPHGGLLMARALHDAGITTLFTLCGGHILGLLDGCLDTGIRVIDTRHEGAAALAAEGWALATGEPGVAAVTAGPGFANALVGLVDAGVWTVPLVLFAGRTGLRQQGRGAVMDVDQAAMAAPVAKRVVRCTATDRIPLAVSEAVYAARAGRPGAVYLEIPQDVFMARATPPDGGVPTGHPRTPPRSAGDPNDIDVALELLQAAERPMVVAGGGVFWSGAGPALGHFAETARIPVTTTSTARGAVPDGHHWCLGTLVHAGISVLSADVVLVLGSAFNANVAFGQPPLFPPGQKVVQVDVRADRIGGNHLPDLAIAGDVGAVLGDLTDGWRKASGDREAWLERARGEAAFMRSTWDDQIAAHRGERLHAGAVAREVVSWARAAIGDRVTFVADGGDALTWLLAYAYAEGPGRLLSTTTALGTLGVGMPFALAAQAARPAEPVILFTGDGAFGLTAMEVDTAVRHGLPVVAVVSNNTGWRDVSHEQDAWHGAGRRVASELADTRYDRLGEALGAHGEHVTTLDALGPALERALASGRPSVINVTTDSEVLSDLLRGVREMGLM